MKAFTFRRKKRNLSRGERVFESVNIILLSLLMLLMLYPLYFTVIASISNPFKVVTGQVYILPVDFTLEAYANTFADNRIWRGYLNTIIYQ